MIVLCVDSETIFRLCVLELGVTVQNLSRVSFTDPCSRLYLRPLHVNFDLTAVNGELQFEKEHEMGNFGWLRLVWVTRIAACCRLECVEGCNLDLLALIVVLSLGLAFLGCRCHLHTCLLEKFSQRTLVKTFVHLDVSSRKNPGPGEKAHVSIPARQQEPTFFVLSHDTASNLVVFPSDVPRLGCLQSIGVPYSIAIWSVVTNFDDVMTVQVWCTFVEPAWCTPSVWCQVDEACVLAEVN